MLSDGPSPEEPLVNALEVQGITHWFADRRQEQAELVLEGLDLHVREEEFVSIIGPSGCGKSTLLYITAGLLSPEEGYVRHGGTPVDGPDRSRGLIFQGDAVFPWLTVEGNVMFGLKQRRVPRVRRKEIAHEYIARVGLAGRESRFPKELSGGMRKRVDVARVFANNPSLLLCDESFGQLDALTKERLQLELLRLWEREQKTVLFVTHDIEEAIFLADRVLVMSSRPGRLVKEIGVPFERPRDFDLKTEPAFQALRRELAASLAVASGDQEAAEPDTARSGSIE